MVMTALQKHPYVIIVMLAWLQGCAAPQANPTAANHVFASFDVDSQPGQYAPIIAPQQTSLEHNRIGRAMALHNKEGKEEIYIATDQPTLYYREQDLVTARGNHYHNLIYRLHFPYVPQPRLTAGKNGGLFVIISLNNQQQPVLITTVHTCGCYLAIVPTSYLSTTAYPKEWDSDRQTVYGESLPGRLDYPAQFSTEWRPVIYLRSGNHRVMNISLSRQGPLPDTQTVRLAPISSLDQLPLDRGQTSFFHQSGSHKGYVKGASKPWEQLLMSWWTFDLNIGHDKRLGDPAETGTVFYTSLKPWARDASNMWFFADFLDYWGWRL